MISDLLFPNHKGKKKQYEHVYPTCASELMGP
jgi:hypothetical protein